MGQIRHVESMFRNVSYNQFPSTVLRTAMEKKVGALDAKITERKGRIEKIMAEHGITHEAMSDMLVQYMKDQERGTARMTYSNSADPSPNTSQPKEVLIPAGVVSNIITEKGLIESETEEARRLRLILRNLKDTVYFNHPETGDTSVRMAIHTLSDEEIEYLGF